MEALRNRIPDERVGAERLRAETARAVLRQLDPHPTVVVAVMPGPHGIARVAEDALRERLKEERTALEALRKNLDELPADEDPDGPEEL